MSREEHTYVTEPTAGPAETELADDWFWRPVQRHTTEFAEVQATASAWRQAGRALQLANRLSSRHSAQQSEHAAVYSQHAARKK